VPWLEVEVYRRYWDPQNCKGKIRRSNLLFMMGFFLCCCTVDKKVDKRVVDDVGMEEAEPAAAMPHPLEPYRAFYQQALHSDEAMTAIR